MTTGSNDESPPSREPIEEEWDIDDQGDKVPTSSAPRPEALTVGDWVTKSRNMDTYLRLLMVGVLAIIFIGLNVGVGYLIHQAYTTDINLLYQKAINPDQRLITEKTFLALITATVAQAGLGIAAVVTYLFPRTGNKHHSTH